MYLYLHGLRKYDKKEEKEEEEGKKEETYSRLHRMLL